MNTATATATDTTTALAPSPRMMLCAVEEAADKVYHATKLPTVTEKDCPRCNGKGYAHFLGGRCAPGPCFRCASKGKLPATRAEALHVKIAMTERDLIRYRSIWKGFKAALCIAEAARAEAVAAGVKQHWTVSHDVEYIATRLARIEDAGKETAAELATLQSKVKK